MKRCDEIGVALSVWSPISGADLPDDLILHIEACPRCTEQFDAHFPPVSLPTAPALRPTGRRQSGAVAVAAMALLALGMSAPEADSDPLAMASFAESPLTIEEMLAADQECPLPIADTDPPVCLEDGGEWM